MKKTVAILSVMLVFVAVFFCVPVNAATYTGSPAVHKNASGSSSGVTYEITLDQYYPEQNADSGIAAGEVYTQVYYRITNNNDDAAYVRNTGFTINWVTAPYIVKYETYTENLYLGFQSTSGSWYIYADSLYSYSSGVVVPPHSSLYCVAYIVTSASVNGNAISSQAISSVSLNSHTITLGDYPYGMNGQQLDEIEDILETIQTSLEFTGSIPSLADVGYNVRSLSFVDAGSTVPSRFSGTIRILRLGSFALSEEIATSLTGMEYRHDCYVVPFSFTFSITNNTGHAVSVDDAALKITDMLSRTERPTVLVYGYDSDLLGYPEFRYVSSTSYLDMYVPIKYQYNNTAYIPSGTYRITYVLLCVFDTEMDTYGVNPGMTMVHTFSTSSMDIAYNNESAIAGINSDLHQLLLAYNSVNGTGDLSSESNSLTEGLNNAHQAEQNYFSDNSQALANSGISNPNFEASDRTGINSAITGNKNQFGMLWNAIGAWRNVYIYAALLCLVTYLLRHKPWISGGRRHRREENG